ncbi:MAG: DNA-directed RNA polymerase subunit omega [Saprospiraceae bacterium]|nr:DNA-directed RNA polymerase subunit omega [Saprospiraceae bacterium]
MTDIKSKVQTIDPNISARDVNYMSRQTSNIYESLVLISKRAKQLGMDIKQELHNKLEEFAVSSDTIEEVNENKEQIEISKFYERLPSPTIIATEEFLANELYHRYKEKKTRPQ